MTNKGLLFLSLLITVFAIHPARAVSVNLFDSGFSNCSTERVVFEKEKEGEKEGETNPEEECE